MSFEVKLIFIHLVSTSKCEDDLQFYSGTQRLPLVLSSLAVAGPYKDLARHLVVGVQNEGDFRVCQSLHRFALASSS